MTSAIGQGGPANIDAVAIDQVLAGDPFAVDECAVRRAEVADAGHQVRSIACHANLGVPPGDSWVVENDVGCVVATQDRDGGEQRVSVPVCLLYTSPSPRD